MTQWLTEPRKRTLKLRIQANLAGTFLFRSMRQMSSKHLDMLADFVRRKYLIRIECHCRRVSLMRSAGARQKQLVIGPRNSPHASPLIRLINSDALAKGGNA